MRLFNPSASQRPRAETVSSGYLSVQLPYRLIEDFEHRVSECGRWSSKDLNSMFRALTAAEAVASWSLPEAREGGEGAEEAVLVAVDALLTRNSLIVMLIR